MKNKKLFAMMTVILAMGLAACGGKTSSKESEKPSSAEPTPSSQVTPSSEATPSSSSEAPKPSSSSSAPQSSQSTPQPSSSAPQSSQSTPQPSSSSSAPQSSSSEVPSSSSEVPPEPVKAVAVSSVNLVAKESKVYLQLAGTATAYTPDEFLWALALQHAGASGAGDAATTFVLGTTAEFADEDYKLPATLNDDGSFLFEYNVSDIAGMEAGLLTIHAGVKGLSENLAVGTVNNGATLKDGTYRFYIRADVNNQNTLAVDELPPVTVTEVSIVMDENDKAWAKIGGVADDSITQAVLDSFDTFIQFQNTSNWSTTRRYKVGTYTIPGQWGRPDTELVVEEDQYYWKLEGNKAFLYADVSFFAAGGNYNTHMNARHPTQADLKMEVALDEKFTMTNAEGVKLDVNVVAVPGASAQADFWGNLGFKVTEWKDPNAHVHSLTAGTAAKNSDGKDVIPVSCTCGKKGAKIAIGDFSSGSDLTGPEYKFASNSEIVYKIIVEEAGDYQLLMSGHNENNQNASEGLTKSPYSVKVGTGESAITFQPSSGTYASLGVGNGTSAEFVMCPTVTLAAGENVVTLVQGSGGNRITFSDFVTVLQK